MDDFMGNLIPSNVSYSITNNGSKEQFFKTDYASPVASKQAISPRGEKDKVNRVIWSNLPMQKANETMHTIKEYNRNRK